VRQLDEKILNIGFLGKGDYPAKIIERFRKEEKIGMCCGLDSFENEEIFKLRDSEELLRVADAVFVFDPAYSTLDELSALLRSSKHIFVQHSGLLSVGELRKLGNLATEAGVVFQVGSKNRFDPMFVDLMDFDIKPRIIEVHRYAEFAEYSTYLSLVDDLLLPDLDSTIALSGSQVKRISASGVGVLYNDPDMITARLEFFNGCVANITVSKISQKEVHKMRLFRNNTFYDANFLKGEIRTLNGESVSGKASKNQTESILSNYQIPVNPQILLEKQIESFYYCIINGMDAQIGPQQMGNARQVAEGIIDQLERNFNST